MKVLLIGNYAPDRQYSMLGFADALLTGLCERDIDARLLAPPQVFGRIPLPNLGKWMAYVDKLLVFPNQLRQAIRQADLVHVCDQGSAVYIKYLACKPHLVTCHDMLAIRAAQGELHEQRVGRTGCIYQTMILKGLSRAQQVVCDSETTRQDVLRIVAPPKDRVKLIYQGLHRPMEPMSEDQSTPLIQAMNLVPGEPFLLHIGGNPFYKNRVGLLRIYAALHRELGERSPRLVMVGQPLTAEMRRIIAAERLDNRIVELVDIDNQHLCALYSCAKSLVFPSLYEGFGLPIIEAQACGCPVFTSDRAPMTEVGGRAAIYFDPAQPELAAQVIAKHLPDMQRMRRAGFDNVRRFAIENMLDAYIRIYQSL